MLPQLHLAWGFLLLVICIAAAIKDLKTFTIPHLYPGLVLALLVPALFFIDLSLPLIGWQILSGLLAFFVGFLLFAIGVMGGGDVKLFAALAIWVPLKHLIVLVMAMTFLGLFYTLGYLIFRSMKDQKNDTDNPMSFLKRIRTNLRSRLPYGPAIALGFAGYLYLINAGGAV